VTLSNINCIPALPVTVYDSYHSQSFLMRSSMTKNEKDHHASIESLIKNQIQYSELVVPENPLIGNGAFGVVYKAQWRGQMVAVKEIRSENITWEEKKKFIEEAEIMRNMKPHRNVVLFLGIIVNPFCIVTEFLGKGDLWSYLKTNSPMDWKLKLRIINDIALGMQHLMLEGVVHRDLAARNILLTENMDAKVSDFGLSRLADSANVVYSKSEIGPLKWMSPEAIRKKRYSEKSDAWSFGVTCVEIFTREEPYADMDAIQVATAVVSEGLKPVVPNNVPQRLSALIDQCFQFEPENRPTFAYICEQLQTI